MNNDEAMKEITGQLCVVFQATNEVLSEWKSEGNLQIPNLMNMLATKLNWSEKQMRESDPLVRFYIKNHPDLEITRGAGGGIRRKLDREKKEQALLAKEKLKQQMKDAIEAKVNSSVIPAV